MQSQNTQIKLTYPELVSINPYEEKLLRKEVEFIKTSPTLGNVNEVLHPFHLRGCLIHLTRFLTTFDHLDVPHFPLILRRLAPHRVTGYQLIEYRQENLEILHYRSLLWKASGIKLPGGAYPTTPKCFNSPSIDPGEYSSNSNSMCAKIQFKSFSLQSKPWRCEVRVGLYPPMFSLQRSDKFEFLPYPGIWDFGTLNNLQSLPFPEEFSKFNVIFVNTNIHQTCQGQEYFECASFHFRGTLHFNHLQNTYYKFPKINLDAVSTDMFFIVETESEQRKLAQTAVKVKCIWNLNVCLDCNITNNIEKYLHHKISLKEWCNMDFLSSFTSMLSKAEQAKWHISSGLSQLYQNDLDFIRYFSECENSDLFNKLATSNALYLLHRAVVHVWRNVMGNYSHQIYQQNGKLKDEVCSNGVIERRSRTMSVYSTILMNFEIKLKVPQYFQVIIPNEMFTLFFLSCGRPQVSPLAFRELVDVFEWRIWLWTFATLLISVGFKVMVIEFKMRKSFDSVLLDVLDFIKLSGSGFSKIHENIK